MNREIEFRGKSLFGSEWVYGFYLQSYNRSIDDEWVEHYIDNGFDLKEEVILETVGQYTGLKDKNGNKIFEGDVVNSENYGEMIIKFADGGYAMTDGRFGIYLHNESWDGHNNLLDLEVIGKINEEVK